MKNTNSFGVHFTLRQQKEFNGKSPIYARICVNKTRVEISLKTCLAESDWNAGRGCPKPRTDELRSLSTYLEEVRSKLVVHYQQLKIGNDCVTACDVKNAYVGTAQPKEGRTLLWLVKEHNFIMKKVLNKGSLKNYFTTERYLEIFLKYHFQGDIFLSQLNYSFLTSFEHFIRTNPLKANDPCHNNGTMKHLERLKKMASWAFQNEWIGFEPFEKFKLKYKKVERESLTVDELHILENRDLRNAVLQKIQKLFVFSRYTGLSFIDVMGLKHSEIVRGDDGFKWLKKIRTKTNVPIDVPILEPASAILDEFLTSEHNQFSDAVFPGLSNQEVNRGLKLIAEICGIRKNLTFHLARHTFATTVTLCNGVPIESISKMLGHSKLTTTMIYAKVIRTKISTDMTLLQSKLNKNKAQQGKL